MTSLELRADAKDPIARHVAGGAIRVGLSRVPVQCHQSDGGDERRKTTHSGGWTVLLRVSKREDERDELWD